MDPFKWALETVSLCEKVDRRHLAARRDPSDSDQPQLLLTFTLLLSQTTHNTMGCGASSLSVEDSQARARVLPFPSLSSLSLAGPSLSPPFLARSVLTRLNLPWLQETRRLRVSSSEIARTCGMRSRCALLLSLEEGRGRGLFREEWVWTGQVRGRRLPFLPAWTLPNPSFSPRATNKS